MPIRPLSSDVPAEHVAEAIARDGCATVDHLAPTKERASQGIGDLPASAMRRRGD